MDPINSQFPKLVIIIILTTSVFSYCYCYADQNQLSSLQCSSFDNSTTQINPYRTNIDNVLNTLSENVNLQNGFYKTTSGKGKEKIYGIVQCRADISAQDCANCTKMSIQEGAHYCPLGNRVTVTFRWCFLKYSDHNFFGVWDDDGLSAVTFESRFDDSETVLKGIDLMSGLAKTTPDLDLMVQTGILDVGKHGKRYGMVQCTKDMSKSNCGKCLDAEAKFLEQLINNSTSKDVFANGCRMWYNDYQFHSNISTTATNGGKRSYMANEGVVAGMIIGALVLLLDL